MKKKSLITVLTCLSVFGVLLSSCTQQGPKGPQGEQGIQGEQGQPGQDGTSVLTGTGVPSDDLGSEGDSYIDLSTWNFYAKENGSWVLKGNIKGEQGSQGEQGPQGEQGESGQQGPQGEQGPQGQPGADGTSVLTGNGVPSDDLGNLGDSYIDLLTWNYYVKEETGWQNKGNIKGEQGRGIDSITYLDSDENVDTYIITYSDGTTSTFTVTNGEQGEQGIQGEAGEDGHTPVISIGANGNWFIDGVDTGFSAKGETGEKGDDGTSILTGRGEPANNLGATGDSYIDLESWDCYVKSEEGWAYQGNIKGIQGNPGQDGADGTSMCTGIGEPNTEIGKNGDSYINLETWDYYVKENDEWVLKGNIKGEDGSNGVSVVSTEINDNGDLIVTYSNGDVVNVGHVKDQNQMCTITFDSCGGTAVESQMVEKGQLITKPENPTRENYGFDGWYTGDGDRWIFKGCAVYESMTLYANWLADKFTITYHLNGGTNSFNNPDSYYAGTDTIVLESPTKNYATFIGWYSDPEFTTACNEITSSTTGNLHLYANFEAILYTFKFVTNSGSAINNVSLPYGSPFPSVSTTRNGFIFKGWYKDSKFNTPYSIPDTMPAIDMTLYAKWEQITFKVSIIQTQGEGVNICPAQNLTNAISSSGKSFVLNSLSKIYLVWRYWDYNNSTMKNSSWKTYTPAATTTKVTFETKGGNYDSSASTTIREYNASGVLTKTSTISFSKS